MNRRKFGAIVAGALAAVLVPFRKTKAAGGSCSVCGKPAVGGMCQTISQGYRNGWQYWIAREKVYLCDEHKDMTKAEWDKLRKAKER